MSLVHVELWHERARPKPTADDLNVQMGCHFEEVAEMLEELTGADDYAEILLVKVNAAMHKLAEAMKSGEARLFIRDREKVLDSLADQIVTAVGVGHCARMNTVEALRRVNDSNWSKFDVDGQPIRDKNGKVSKGPRYEPPNLEGLW